MIHFYNPKLSRIIGIVEILISINRSCNTSSDIECFHISYRTRVNHFINRDKNRTNSKNARVFLKEDNVKKKIKNRECLRECINPTELLSAEFFSSLDRSLKNSDQRLDSIYFSP